MGWPLAPGRERSKARGFSFHPLTSPRGVTTLIETSREEQPGRGSWIDSQPVAAPTDPTTHYVVVRPDLPLGVLAAQVTHAAGESSPGGLRAGTYAVVLQASPEDLEELRGRLEAESVPHRAIIENDEPYRGQLMAVGLEPRPRSEVKKYVRSLRLLT